MAHETIPVDGEVRLSVLSLDYAGEMFDLIDNNRAYLGKFLPWPATVDSVERERRDLRVFLNELSNGELLGYGIFYLDKLVGHISLMHLKDEQEPEIGYWISEDSAGKGVMTRAARALTDFGFDTLGLDEIVIRADARNIGSNKVAEKAGYLLMNKRMYDEDETINTWVRRVTK